MNFYFFQIFDWSWSFQMVLPNLDSMRKFGVVGLLFLTSLVSTGQTLKVSVSDSPPVAYVNQDGIPSGLFVDVLNEIALLEGWTLQYQSVIFNSGLNQLRSHSTDIMVNLARDTDREKYILFNNVAFYTTFGQLFTKDGSLETLPDLEGKKIGYLNSDYFAMEPEDGFLALLEASSVEVDVIPFNSYEEMTRYLEEDLIDGGVFSRPYGFSRFMMDELWDADDIVSAPMIFAPTSLFIGFPADSTYQPIIDRIDHHLVEFRKDKGSPYYASLRSNLLTRKESYVPTEIVILLLLATAGICTFFVFNRLLNFQVKQKTAEVLKAKDHIEAQNRKLGLALQAVQESIWEWDIQTNEVIVDEHSFNIMGFDQSGNTVSWSELMQLIIEEDKERFNKSFETYFNDHSDMHEVSFRARTNSGEVRWFTIHGKVVSVDDEGKPTRYLGTAVDIHDRKTTEEQLEAAETLEREKIARELHDGVQQSLSAAVLNLSYVLDKKEQETGEVRKKLETGIEGINGSIKEIRNLAHELDFNLVPAVEKLVNELDVSTVEIDFISNLGNERLPHNQEKALYRIVQEAVTNILKHASATNATIQLMKYPDLTILTIEDNGQGFDTEQVSSAFGLKSMRNRARHIHGHLSIDSRPGKGTQIVVEIQNKEAKST